MKPTLRSFVLFAAVGFGLLAAPRIVLAVDPPIDTYQNVDIDQLRNLSGGTRSHGDAVVYQTRDNDTEIEIGATPGQRNSLGLDITTTTSADSRLFAGCIAPGSDCLDNELCRVIVRGPAMCRWAGATDNSNTRGTAVGTTTVAGQLGTGLYAGVMLSLSVASEDSEVNATNDGEVRWIDVHNPAGSN